MLGRPYEDVSYLNAVFHLCTRCVDSRELLLRADRCEERALFDGMGDVPELPAGQQNEAQSVHSVNQSNNVSGFDEDRRIYDR